MGYEKSRIATRTLVLLTLNEIDGVRTLVPQLPTDIPDEILAVDGGSTDGTPEFLDASGIRVIVQKRRGRGEAFRVAMDASIGDHMVFYSPDGNENMSDIPLIFNALEAGADMVIASRFLPGSRNEEDDDYFPLRKWTNQVFTLMANWFWNRGPYVTDTINGFRGITRKAFKRLSLESMGYTIEFEMTIRAMRYGLNIVEIPTFEGNRLGGKTKGPSLKVGWDFIWFFVRQIFQGR